MAKPCSLLCTKAYLIIFNMIFLLCGGATLGLGVWMCVDKNTFVALQIAQSSSSPVVDQTPYVLMGLGAAMMVVCFMGGCGACADSVCFLTFYSIILFLLILAEVIVVALAVAKKDALESTFSTKMLEQVRYSYNWSTIPDANKTDVLTYAWDAMQVELQCCGAKSPNDYMFSTWWNHTKNSKGMAVPYTCCVLFNDNPDVPSVRDNVQCQVEGHVYQNDVHLQQHQSAHGHRQQDQWLELHPKGCVEAVKEWVEAHSHIFISVLVTCIVLELLGLFCSCFLVVRLKRDHGKDWTDEDLREEK